MKKFLISLIFLLFSVACVHAATQNTLISAYSSNCPALSGSTYVYNTLCFESDGPAYICNPSTGPTGFCSVSNDWKIVPGLWVDSGTTITLKNNRSVNIGSNLLQGNATTGLTLNPSGDGSTTVSFLPTGLLQTSAGMQYLGNDGYLNVNRTNDKTTPNTGDLYFNTQLLAWIYYNGTALKRLPVLQFNSYNITSPSSSSNKILFVPPVNLKIESINCITDTGSAPITIQQCNSSGTACSNINTTISCTTSGANDGGGISTPNITSGNYVNLNVGTVSGSPTSLNVTVAYSQNE